MAGRLILALVIVGSTVGAVVGITGAPARAASAPGLAIAKSASVSSYSSAGTVITYTYVVINTGSSTLPNVTVTDPMPGLSAINCGGNSNVIPSLAPSTSVTCTATYTTTQSDVDLGSISNTGTADSDGPVGNFSAVSSVTVPAVQTPGITVAKSANTTGYTAAGTVITYSYVVTNTGNLTLSNVVVTDPMAGLSAINCGGNSNVIPSLAPGASVTCTATYTTTGEDVKDGSITNTGTATATTPEKTTVSSDASLTIPEGGQPFTCNPPTDFLSQGSPTTQLFNSTTVANVTTYHMDGPPYSKTYNAIGFDLTNDYIYGIDVGTNTMIQIDGTGHIIFSHAVSGLPKPPKNGSYNVGAFDAANNYWVMRSGTTTAYEIDAGSPTPSVIGTKSLSSTFAPADWALDNGYMWGTEDQTIYRTNLSTGSVSSWPEPGIFPAVGGPNPGTYGAAWTFGNGNLGFSNNYLGTIFQVAVTNPSAVNPGFSLVSSYSGPVAGNSNDGTACGSALPTDLGIVKTGPSTVPAGGTITWQLTVTNYGPGPSSGFAVADNVPAGITNVSTSTPGCVATGNSVLCSEGALAVGNTFTILLTGTAPTAPGSCVVNTATVTANEADSNQENNTSGVQTCTTPDIILTKTASQSSYSTAGTAITYNYLVTNPNVSEALTNVTVTDPMVGLSPIDCGGNSDVIPVLNAGGSQSCTATYTTTQADVNAGSISNTGTVVGTPPYGSNVTSSSTLTIPGEQAPAVSLVKSANVASYSTPGTVITYSYLVTNTGSVTLTNVTVNDPMAGLSPIDCGGNSNVIPTLAPGASVTCTATYVTTQADVTAGSVNNEATVSGTAPDGSTVGSKAELSIPQEGTPLLCDPPVDYLSQGIPTALFAGTEGNATVVYNQVGPTYSQTYNALGFDTQNDYLYAMTGGDLLQIDGGGNVLSSQAVTNWTATGGPNVGAFDNSGNYWVTHTGDTTAYEIDVTSSPPAVINTVTLSQAFGADDWSLNGGYMWGLDNGTTLYRVDLSTGTVTTFAAPGSLTTGTYGAAWTFGNGNLGFSNNQNGLIYQISVANPSSASPTFSVGPPYQGPVAGQNNDGTSCAGLDTDLGIVKTGPATVQPGATIAWHLTVTNYGPGISSGFAVDDNVPAGIANVATTTPGCTVTGNNVVCGEGTLAVGGTFTITLTGTAPTTDGTCVDNTATVTANEADLNVNNNTSTVQTCTAASVVVVKTATVSSYTTVGTLITYLYKVTNTTDGQPLTNLTVTDPMKGLSAINCGDGTNQISVLESGGSQSCVAHYVTTQSDLDAGSITNIGTVTGTPETGPAVSATSSLTIPANQSPAISLIKSADVSGFSQAGQPIHYTYQVTNSGNVTLTDVSVTDPMDGLSSISCGDGTDQVSSLAPDGTATCTASYTTTSEDVDAGSVTNTATASGTDPGGDQVTSNTSTVTVPDTTLRVVTTSLADGETGVPYSATLSAAGGTTPYKWSVVSGKLPSGLKLNAKTGDISGSPKSAGTSSITVEVKDTKSASMPSTSATQALTLTVSGPTPSVTAVKPSDGPVGGGTKVTVVGTNLEGATAVYFGSAPATKVTASKTGTSITVVDPAGDPGRVPLEVVTPNGDSPVTTASQFTYE